MEHIKSQSQGMVTRDPEHGHEESDINIKAILGFGIFLILMAATIHILMFGMYKGLNKWADANEEKAAPMTLPETQQAGADQTAAPLSNQQELEMKRIVATFPQPRLQADEVRDLNEMRAHEKRVMESYVWVDQANGTIRIPIDRALELVAQRGLPQTKGAAKPAVQAPKAQPAPATPAPAATH